MAISQFNPTNSPATAALSRVNAPSPATRGVTISEALPLWAASMQAEGRAVLGMRTYLERIRQFQRWLSINEHSGSLDDLSPLHIQAYLKTLRDVGLKPKTIELSYTVIGCFLSWAVDSELIARNSAKKVKVIRSKPTPPKVADFTTVQDQVEQMAHTRFRGIDARDRFAYLFMLYTGCRVSEACDVTWNDIDWEKNIVTIHQTKGGEAVVRWVPLHDKLRLELIRWRSVAQMIWPEQEHVLISRRGKPVHRADIEMAFQRRAWYNPHALRHAFALRCMENGQHVRKIQQYLGHRSLDMTARYLAILSPDVGADAQGLSAAF